MRFVHHFFSIIASGMAFHSSTIKRSNLPRFWGILFSTLSLTIAQRFSMGLRSGLLLGQSITLGTFPEGMIWLGGWYVLDRYLVGAAIYFPSFDKPLEYVFEVFLHRMRRPYFEQIGFTVYIKSTPCKNLCSIFRKISPLFQHFTVLRKS